MANLEQGTGNLEQGKGCTALESNLKGLESSLDSVGNFKELLGQLLGKNAENRAKNPSIPALELVDKQFVNELHDIGVKRSGDKEILFGQRVNQDKNVLVGYLCDEAKPRK